MTNTAITSPVHEESTYQLFIRSEEGERGLFEGIVYLLLVIATMTAISQFGLQPFGLVERSATPEIRAQS